MHAAPEHRTNKYLICNVVIHKRLEKEERDTDKLYFKHLSKLNNEMVLQEEVKETDVDLCGLRNC